MMNNISPREYEQLSAYLDGQLNERDRLRLEARLRTAPELSSALEDLRRTRQLLRSLPPMKAPRSFKLTPQMVGEVRRPRPIFPVFQFASALATLLLVLVLAGDLLGFRFGGAPPMNASQPQVAMQRGATQPTLAAALAATAQAFAPLAPQATSVPGSAEALPLMASPTGTPEPPAAASKVAGTAPEATAGVTGLAAGQTLSTTVSSSPENPPNGMLSAAQPTGEAHMDTAVPSQAPTPQPVFPPVRIAEIVLAFVAVSFGLAAYFLRRSSGV